MNRAGGESGQWGGCLIALSVTIGNWLQVLGAEHFSEIYAPTVMAT